MPTLKININSAGKISLNYDSTKVVVAPSDPFYPAVKTALSYWYLESPIKLGQKLTVIKDVRQLKFIHWVNTFIAKIAALTEHQTNAGQAFDDFLQTHGIHPSFYNSYEFCELESNDLKSQEEKELEKNKLIMDKQRENGMVRAILLLGNRIDQEIKVVVADGVGGSDIYRISEPGIINTITRSLYRMFDSPEQLGVIAWDKIAPEDLDAMQVVTSSIKTIAEILTEEDMSAFDPSEIESPIQRQLRLALLRIDAVSGILDFSGQTISQPGAESANVTIIKDEETDEEADVLDIGESSSERSESVETEKVVKVSQTKLSPGSGGEDEQQTVEQSEGDMTAVTSKTVKASKGNVLVLFVNNDDKALAPDMDGLTEAIKIKKHLRGYNVLRIDLNSTADMRNYLQQLKKEPKYFDEICFVGHSALYQIPEEIQAIEERKNLLPQNKRLAGGFKLKTLAGFCYGLLKCINPGKLKFYMCEFGIEPFRELSPGSERPASMRFKPNEKYYQVTASDLLLEERGFKSDEEISNMSLLLREISKIMSEKKDETKYTFRATAPNGPMFLAAETGFQWDAFDMSQLHLAQDEMLSVDSIQRDDRKTRVQYDVRLACTPSLVTAYKNYKQKLEPVVDPSLEIDMARPLRLVERIRNF